jgi:predicted amidophosphoribosyltransferase
MTLDLAQLRPQPAGFAACTTCAYRSTGTPSICFACAEAGSPGPPARRCEVCGQDLAAEDRCPNTVCSYGDRWFSRIYTVSARPEEMWKAVYEYKYGGRRDLAPVLGRILRGYLEVNRQHLAGYHVVTTGALYIGPRAVRLWDYLQPVLEAGLEGQHWPFVPGLIAKSGPTARFLGISAEARRQIAEGELRRLLSVPEPERVVGKRVLVFDDIYSEGFSLREMARVLRLAGAAEVAGLVLARRKGG